MILIENFIPFGNQNAVTREQLGISTGLNDRQVRKEIHEASVVRGVQIVNCGFGYFRPDGSQADSILMHEYLLSEEAKAKSIFMRIKSIRKALCQDENQISIGDL